MPYMSMWWAYTIWACDVAFRPLFSEINKIKYDLIAATLNTIRYLLEMKTGISESISQNLLTGISKFFIGFVQKKFLFYLKVVLKGGWWEGWKFWHDIKIRLFHVFPFMLFLVFLKFFLWDIPLSRQLNPETALDPQA